MENGRIAGATDAVSDLHAQADLIHRYLSI